MEVRQRQRKILCANYSIIKIKVKEDEMVIKKKSPHIRNTHKTTDFKNKTFMDNMGNLCSSCKRERFCSDSRLHNRNDKCIL